VIGTPWQKVAHGFDRFAPRGVDDIGCPESSGRVESLLLDVDHNDPRGTGYARAADCVEPDPSSAKDYDRVTGPHVGGVQDGASARYDAAPEQCSLREGDLLRHDSELVFVDECLFGKATQPETLEQAKPVATQARRLVCSAQCRLWVLALERAAGETSSARSARLRKRPDDVIADTDVPDIRTD